MEPAPLPPHERQWRHPSELGPTSLVGETSSTGRALTLTSGAMAAVLVAVMVVSFTPRRSGAPSALSATTLPAASVQLQSQPTRTGGDELIDSTVRIERRNVSRNQTLTLTGAPNAVSAAPATPADDLDLARGLPENDDRVIVLTMSHTYDVTWGDIERLDAPDGSIVITPDGGLLATFVDGQLRMLID